MRRMTLAGALAAACLAVVGASPLRAEEFFPTRDENPLLRGFYRPLASDTRADAGAVLAATFSIMNTLESEKRSTQQLLVDGESDTLRLSYEDSITHDWRYRVTVPVIRDSGGFLDSSIASWHPTIRKTSSCTFIRAGPELKCRNLGPASATSPQRRVGMPPTLRRARFHCGAAWRRPRDRNSD
jgi:hypothetical protein